MSCSVVFTLVNVGSSNPLSGRTIEISGLAMQPLQVVVISNWKFLLIARVSRTLNCSVWITTSCPDGTPKLQDTEVAEAD